VAVDARLAATDAGRLDDALVERLGRHRDKAIVLELLTQCSTGRRMSGCAPRYNVEILAAQASLALRFSYGEALRHGEVSSPGPQSPASATAHC
jgi:hypothetical protein